MQPHEWANQIGRTADNYLRTVEGMTEKYYELKEVSDSLRMLTDLQGETNRQVDDASVGLTRVVDELDSMSRKVDDLTFDLKSAVAGAWNQ